MSGRGDRQELGRALDEAEHECLPVRQRLSAVPHPECGQDDRSEEGGARREKDAHPAHRAILEKATLVGWLPVLPARTVSERIARSECEPGAKRPFRGLRARGICSRRSLLLRK